MTAVTRTNKANDRDHAGLADGTAGPEQHLPRFFGKANGFDNDSRKIKKEGGGRSNWYGLSVVIIYSIAPFSTTIPLLHAVDRLNLDLLRH